MHTDTLRRRIHAAVLCLGVLWASNLSCTARAAAQTACPDPLYRALVDQATDGETSVLVGREDWLFFLPELRHLAAGEFWGPAAERTGRASSIDARDPLPAILAFHRALQEQNAHLLLVPVPPMGVIHYDRLPDAQKRRAARRPDPQHEAFYRKLRAEGVDVLDLTQDFLATDESERGPLYCRQDTHWSGVGCVVAAQVIAARLRSRLADLPRKNHDYAWETIGIRGDLWRMLGDESRAKERLQVRTVSGADPDPGSPVLLLGDSHALVFQAGGDMHGRNAGLAAQLAVELGLPVDLIAVRGSGATPARINLFRRARREAEYWTRKRVVIWVFAAREFTESDGWRIVPVAP